MFSNRMFPLILVVSLASMPAAQANATERKVGENLSQSQAHQPQKVGVIDVQRVFSAIPQSTAAKNKLKKQFEPRDLKLKNMMKDIQTWTQQLEKEVSVMAEKDRIELQRKIESQKQSLDFEGRALQEDMRKSELKEMEEINTLMRKATEKIRIAKKLDVIIGVQATFGFDQKIDITDDVIKAMSELS